MMIINIIDIIFLYTIYIFLYNIAMYVFSRLFQVRVDKFYVWYDTGFHWFKFKKGDTEYGLGWIPAGGYLKISGMLLAEDEELKPYHFKAASPLKQVLIILSGPLICLFIGVFVYMLKLPKVPNQFYYYSIGYLALIAIVLFVYKLLIGWITRLKPDRSTNSTSLGVYLMSFFFLALILVPAFLYINELTPFFLEVKAIFSGEQELSFSAITNEGWLTVLAFFGVWFFLGNMIPLGGLNGSVLIGSLYAGIAGEEVPSKLSNRFRVITVPLLMGVYGYMVYLLLF